MNRETLESYLMEAAPKWIRPTFAREEGEWVPLARALTGASIPKDGAIQRRSWRSQMIGGKTDKARKLFNRARLVDFSTTPQHRIDKIQTVFPHFSDRKPKIHNIYRHHGGRDVRRIEDGVRSGAVMPAPGLFSYREKSNPMKRRDVLIGGNHRWAMARAYGHTPRVIHTQESSIVMRAILMEGAR